MFVGLSLAACTVGPDYSPQSAPVATHYKELTGRLKGWKVASPSDTLERGDWWGVYHDARLGLLLRQVEISNQTVAAQAAAYEEARALIREAQSALFPTLNGNYNYNRTRTGPAAGGSGSASASAGRTASYSTTFTPQLNGSWDLDVWGRVRRQIEANASAAQASAADLANAKLSAQAQLATAYFELRAADSLRDLLTRTVAQYKRTLTITQNQYNAGVVSQADVITAQTQLLATQAQLINVGAARAQYEHAIAMLIGRPPTELTIASHLLAGQIPKIPVAVPSTLLERRPDIAGAERTMEQENALIGVAIAGYFPDITLSGLLEWIGTHPLPFNIANAVWSLGAAGSETIFNGGLTGAQVDAARALYWQSVANYRSTVLTAFQQVEDELSNIRVYSQQLGIEQQAVAAARRAVDIYMNQYQAGTVAFTTVVTAEATLLGDEEAELTVRQNLFVASVSLIEALGGGWDTTLLPTQPQLEKDFSFVPQLPSTPTPVAATGPNP